MLKKKNNQPGGASADANADGCAEGKVTGDTGEEEEENEEEAAVEGGDAAVRAAHHFEAEGRRPIRDASTKNNNKQWMQRRRIIPLCIWQRMGQYVKNIIIY
mmetsp:Transcript_31673/g.54017  ORF Transcript_31673/g.54017 Transcript_31673/m.54017 type:complete len:102 (-) Transcript_31673:31-336(-)